MNYDYDVLLSTTIVENGIDISNANTIIIINAHHFGLSDLHQMRGRVGRSNKEGFLLSRGSAEEYTDTRCSPPTGGVGDLLRSGKRVQPRHAGPRHSRCRKPAWLGAERIHGRPGV